MIRSVCLGVADKHLINNTDKVVVENFVTHVESAIKNTDCAVQTIRLTLSPLAIKGYGLNSLNNFVETISNITNNSGIRWFCLPINVYGAKFSEMDINIIAHLLNRYDNLFVNIIPTKNHTIDINALKETAEIITCIARSSANGSNCFRVGVSANAGPNTPFFPFSYHEGNACFTIALETNKIAIDVLNNAHNITFDEFETKFVNNVIAALRKVHGFSEQVSQMSSVRFGGVDVSLAPFPDGKNSVAKVIELLGKTSVGGPGSVGITAYLTNLIQKTVDDYGMKRVGFNGVMYSVMEDNMLAEQSMSGVLTLEKLMLLSSVCGCGIDMVPISGLTTANTISSYLLDMSAMAMRLQKPLGTRFLPIPGKLAGEITDINGDFICNTRILHTNQKSIVAPIDSLNELKIIGGFNG